MKDKTIYALGFFDGVHLGHQALLEACRRIAREQNCRPGAVTFTAHPDGFVKGKAPALICTETQRRHLLEQQGIVSVVELNFDKALMTMPWKDFIQMLQAEHGAAGFVCGADFRFGYKGEGTAEILKEYCDNSGVPCAIVPEQRLDGIRISSSHIRTLLEQGDVAQANRFLGHPYTISGKVVTGRGLGHTLGSPTANVQLSLTAVQLRCGVYACKTNIDGKEYKAVTNIGWRPTVDGHHITVEAWILDFDADLYGRELTLALYDFLRPEEKFADLAALKAQIQADAAKTQAFFQ